MGYTGVEAANYSDEIFKGTINLIYPTIDAATRTFPIEIKLDNRDQRVRPGMFARATNWVGEQPGICTMAKTCGHAGVMEFNGDMKIIARYTLLPWIM